MTKLKTLFLEMKLTWKEAGFKGLYKRFGIKLFIAFFVYYLVRDILIYIILPWSIAQKALN